MEKDISFMQRALEEAYAAGRKGEVPVGAVIVDPRGHIVACAGNASLALFDPSAHAEMCVIRAACKAAGAQRLPMHDLYVTLEPCTMCAGVISFARLRRVIYGTPDPKGGAVDHGAQFFTLPTCHHRPHVTRNILAKECGDLLRSFFAARR